MRGQHVECVVQANTRDCCLQWYLLTWQWVWPELGGCAMMRVNPYHYDC